MEAKLAQWFMAIAFTIIGIAMIIGGIFTAMYDSQFEKNAVPIMAQVVDVREKVEHDENEIKTSYTVYVAYQVDGIEYKGKYKTSSHTSKGNIVTVYYDSQHPEQMRESRENFGGVMIVLLGILFSIAGLGMLIHKINILGGRKKLMEKGDRILANFEEVAVNTAVLENGKHPYRIICKAEDSATGEMRVFASENIYGNPKSIIQRRNITAFPVYIDPNNRKKYYLSLEEIDDEIIEDDVNEKIE